jgi:hypothetical protein
MLVTMYQTARRHRKTFIDRQRSRVAFGRCIVGISAGTPAILSKIFRGFTPYLHVNFEIVR